MAWIKGENMILRASVFRTSGTPLGLLDVLSWDLTVYESSTAVYGPILGQSPTSVNFLPNFVPWELSETGYNFIAAVPAAGFVQDAGHAYRMEVKIHCQPGTGEGDIVVGRLDNCELTT